MEKFFYILIKEIQQGPFGVEELRQMLLKREIDSSTLCWFEGATGWSPIATAIPEIIVSIPPPPIIPYHTSIESSNKNFEIAGVGSRCVAALVDFVIVVVFITFFSFLAVIGGFVISAAYIIATMCSPQLQGTIGMKIMGIKIVDKYGDTINPGASIIRYIASFVSAFILMIGYFMIFFSEKNQTLHDRIVDTYVVKR